MARVRKNIFEEFEKVKSFGFRPKKRITTKIAIERQNKNLLVSFLLFFMMSKKRSANHCIQCKSSDANEY